MSQVKLSAKEVQQAAELFLAFHRRFAGFFRTKTREMSRQARQYLQGLLVCLERGNMVRFEKVVPQSDHQSLQHFLSVSPWKEAGVLEALQGRVIQVLGDPKEGSVHIDEVGFPKSGGASVGVKWQYCGHAGKVENCQVGVFLGYVRGSVRTLIDRRLFLPEEWAEDQAKREKCGVPPGVVYHSKGELGLEMLLEAKGRGLPFGWVGMDSGYGSKPWLLERLEQEGIEYIADIPCDSRVWVKEPKVGIPQRRGGRGRPPSKVQVLAGEEAPVEVRQVVEGIAQQEWGGYYVRDSERGKLWSQMVLRRVYPVRGELPGPESWLVIRREGEGKLKYQLSNAPPEVSKGRLARMSHSRYWMERAIQDAQGETGMGDYEVRGWVGWHHHMTMMLLAMLFLVELQRGWKGKAPELTVQDVREILEVILPRREITAGEIIRLLEQKHKARLSARNSHHRKQEAERQKV